MTDLKRPALLTAAGVSSLLAISSITGAAGVLANPGDLDGEALGVPDGYAMAVEDSGGEYLIDGVPLLSEYEDDDDHEEDDHEDHDDDYEDEDDDHEEDDEYDDHEEDEHGGVAAMSDALDPERQYGLDEIVDVVGSGARLTLAFDQANDTFAGLLENTGSDDLAEVQVAIQLPDGTELTSEPIDLAAGDASELALPSTGATFDSYAVQVQVGQAEPMG